MTLGFTKSKVDSKLCFKVEGERPVMLLLCVNALFSRHGGVAECGWNLPRPREVCSRDLEQVQDDGLHDHTYGIELEAIECCFMRYGWYYYVLSDDQFLDVLDEYETIYLLCCELIETCST